MRSSRPRKTLREAAAWRRLAHQFGTDIHSDGLCDAIQQFISHGLISEKTFDSMSQRTHEYGHRVSNRHAPYGWPVIRWFPDPARVAYCLRQARRCERKKKAK